MFGGVPENKAEPPTIKFKDEHVAWRDDEGEGNTLLHIAAWRGDVQAARCIFNSVKARKMTSVKNKKGATPLALAIISGQVRLYLKRLKERFLKEVFRKGFKKLCVIIS